MDNAPRDVAEYFNTSCFVNATTGTFGTAGRNSVWGPGNKNWDFALFKNGKITERFNYQFRAEFFNFLNHPSFGGTSDLSNTIGAGNFGQITAPTTAGDPVRVKVIVVIPRQKATSRFCRAGEGTPRGALCKGWSP